MNSPVIMVAVTDHQWTLNALADACALAGKTGAAIALVQMIPVQHPQWLGTDFGYFLLTNQDTQQIAEYEALLEEAGVEFETTMFQYTSLAEAIVQAAEYVHAQTVFARVPESIIPMWTKFQNRMFNHRLSRVGCQWNPQTADPTERIASLFPVTAH